MHKQQKDDRKRRHRKRRREHEHVRRMAELAARMMLQRDEAAAHQRRVQFLLSNGTMQQQVNSMAKLPVSWPQTAYSAQAQPQQPRPQHRVPQTPAYEAVRFPFGQFSERLHPVFAEQMSAVGTGSATPVGTTPDHVPSRHAAPSLRVWTQPPSTTAGSLTPAAVSAPSVLPATQPPPVVTRSATPADPLRVQTDGPVPRWRQPPLTPSPPAPVTVREAHVLPETDLFPVDLMSATPPVAPRMHSTLITAIPGSAPPHDAPSVPPQGRSNLSPIVPVVSSPAAAMPNVPPQGPASCPRIIFDRPRQAFLMNGVPVITFFHHQREYGEFSNFYACNFVYKERVFPTAEHAFHYEKFNDNQIVQLQYFERALLLNASRALKLAQAWFPTQLTEEQRTAWYRRKQGVMEEIVLQKFSQNRQLANLLKSTGKAVLVEDTAESGDRYWGWGVDGKGENGLGRALMRARQQILGSTPDPTAFYEQEASIRQMRQALPASKHLIWSWIDSVGSEDRANNILARLPIARKQVGQQ